MDQFVYAVQKPSGDTKARIHFLKVLPTTNTRFYFQDKHGDEGSFLELLGMPAKQTYFRSQFDSVQGTVRCTGCHSYVNLAAEFGSKERGIPWPSATAYSDEFKDHFKSRPKLAATSPMNKFFDNECYAGAPCIENMRVHYVRGTHPLKPMRPSPNPLLYVDPEYRRWYESR